MKRADIYWAALDPTIGTEIQKTRPCVIISPDEMNRVLPRVIVAPVTSTLRDLPFRYRVRLGGQERNILLDQIRTLDKSRLTKKLDRLTDADQIGLFNLLQEMFSK